MEHYNFEQPLTDEEQKELEIKAKEVSKLFHDTFKNPVGKKCLAHLKHTFVNRQIVRGNDTQFEAGIRQGEANVILKLIQEVEKII